MLKTSAIEFELAKHEMTGMEMELHFEIKSDPREHFKQTNLAPSARAEILFINFLRLKESFQLQKHIKWQPLNVGEQMSYSI
jgi:hypothetical protein